MGDSNALLMKCEICGRDAHLRRALVEGVEMMVCQDCSRYGTPIEEKKRRETKLKKKAVPYSRDVFKNMDQELVSGWGRKIARAREQKGMTREQLGARVGERTVTIAKIENEELRPPDETVKKIEKELEISLFQKVEGAVVRRAGESKGLTIGDLLKNAK